MLLCDELENNEMLEVRDMTMVMCFVFVLLLLCYYVLFIIIYYIFVVVVIVVLIVVERVQSILILFL